MSDNREELEAEIKMLAREHGAGVARKLKGWLVRPQRMPFIGGIAEEMAELEAALTVEPDEARRDVIVDLIGDAEIRAAAEIARHNVITGWEDIERRDEFMIALKNAVQDIAPLALKLAATLAA
jgi:hypothetical protein